MNIHEYQAKEIFKRYGIPVNTGKLARTADEVYKIACEIARPDQAFAVKAQVHAGGRGKGGGIKIVKKPEEARDAAAKIFEKNLVTPQTGPEGKPVESILVETTISIAKEYYAACVLDRSTAKLCLILSEAGGMDIEAVARELPDKIIKLYFPVNGGLNAEQARDMAVRLGVKADTAGVFAQVLMGMAKLFVDLDASLVEINPLAIMASGELLAIDAKINFDDNGLYRHPEIAALADPRQEDPREVEAKKYDLSYVGLDGNIGCIVNGAGLAMATMDIIKYAGGEPANFLDVGGGANKEKVANAFKIILRDSNVKAILVNIFGGIMRCDVVAEGILAAVGEVGLKVPLVVRLEGTNVKEGKELLSKSSIKVISAGSFEEAAEKAVGVL